MSREGIVAELARLNPDADLAALCIYADALLDYRAAQENIAEHGTVVFHPRTGAPIDNPYLRIRAQAAGLLLKLDLDSGGLWG